MHVCGYEARIGIRKLVTVKNDRVRITIDDLWYRFTLSIKIDRIPYFEILRFLILLFCGSSNLLFGI